MAKPVIKALLLDLDNTLVDFVRMKRNSISAAVRAMRKAGLKTSESKAFAKIFGIYNRSGWEDQTVFQKFLRKTLGRVDYKILAHGILAYRKEKEHNLMTYEGVKETLAKLKRKGLKLGIVTDAPKLQAYTRLVALGIEDYFGLIVCFEDTRRRKPSQLPFAKALSRLGVKPGEVLFVGDSLRRDVQGAREFGMRTAWAKYGVTGRTTREQLEAASFSPVGEKTRAKPDFVLCKFGDLLGIA